MYKSILFTGAIASTVLSGCSINPVNYETTPVQIQTPQGTVVCQLYTKERVLWDRAIGVPAGMSVETGDTICKNEGIRLKTKN